MVLRFGGYGSRLTVLLQSTEDMCETLLTWHCPVAYVVIVALVGGILVFLFCRCIVRMDVWQLVHLWQSPCCRAIGYESIGKQYHGCHVLQGYLASHICRVEAVGRTRGCNHWHRALAVSTIESLQQVGLLALRRQSCRRTTALYVDDYQWQLVDDGKVDGLRLQTESWS